MLNEENQTHKATGCVVAFIGRSRKDKTLGTGNRSVVEVGGEQEADYQENVGFGSWVRTVLDLDCGAS